MPENQDKTKLIEVTKRSSAAPPDARRPLWARHPRVFLDVLAKARPPALHCGAQYKFAGESPRGHH